MNFDVIITTLNRPNSLLNLLSQINLCTLKPNFIFIINSGFFIDEIKYHENAIQIFTKHQNQPYQRKLGVYLSRADYVVFLDDDLVVKDFNIFNYLLNRVSADGVSMSGVLMGMVEPSTDMFRAIDYSNIPFSIRIPSFSFCIYPGKSVFGFDPYKMEEASIVDCLTGGNGMTCKRDLAFEIIDWFIIMLADKGMAQGEDKYISMRAGYYGNISFENRLAILHPSNISNYISSRQSIVIKNLEFGRKKLLLTLTKKSFFNLKIIKIIYFIWILIWHILIEAILVLFEFDLGITRKKYMELSIKFISIIYAIKNTIIVDKKSKIKWNKIVDAWLMFDKINNEIKK